MDEEEDRTFGLCKCCLRDGCFKSLWIAYDDNGMQQQHNYGDMLNECFSLQWQKPDNIHLEHICDECIKHTSDAFNFRRKVLSSQEQLESHSEPISEMISVVSEVLDPESGQMTFIVKLEPKSEPTLVEVDEVTGEYEEVEYLEVDVEKEQPVEDPKPCPEQFAPKWPGMKRRRMRYKNYSSEAYKQCVEAVQSGRMSVGVASAHYNVPRKTVASKILSDKRGEQTSAKADKNHQMIKEIKTLLTYTNATPYKTRTAHYHCAYCSTYGPVFEDADELRTHTRTQHAGERTESVEFILRPLWLNEVLKVDIENLHCTVCCVVLVSWNDMFKHLNEQHNLEFDQLYTRVIPYILQNELRCALCKALFPNYHQLDGHMNAHYNNYMCSECGDTFLAASRLKKHLKIHETGRFTCDDCGKVFSLEKYRKKHIELVHKLEQNVRCRYCEEKFLGTYSRHLHVLEVHPEKVMSITCEMCGKIFDWRPYFLAHVRRTHNNEKNYTCSVCDARFFMKSEQKRHEASHEKNTSEKFSCIICGKSYGSKSSLITHQNKHDIVLEFNDIEASVDQS